MEIEEFHNGIVEYNSDSKTVQVGCFIWYTGDMPAAKRTYRLKLAPALRRAGKSAFRNRTRILPGFLGNSPA